MALLPVLVALGVQLALWPIINPYAWFLFFPAIFASAWIGGGRSGMVATIVAALTVWYVFIPPRYSLLVESPRNLFPATIFVGMGFVLSIVRDRLANSRRQAIESLESMRAANDQLRGANDEITRLYEKTRELEVLKSQFFANVSHELRTPLALILGPTEQILASGEADADTRHRLELVDRNARLLLKHVDDLLDASSLEAGRAVLHYARVDLAALVRLVGSYYEAPAIQRRITLSIAADDPLLIDADADKLHRVLMNLLANAVKFTPDGGTIRVAAGADPDRARAVIEVADSGPGVPSDQREEVFERFTQVIDAAKRPLGGTGLGLSIVRDFVALHAGTVTIADAQEGGALVRVELPLVAPAGIAVSPAANGLAALAEPARLHAFGAVRTQWPAAGREDGPLVLVIEDDPDLSAFICDVLRDDYRIEAAFDGREGLEKTRRLRPDIVLCDVMMPGSGGEEYLETVRADPDLDNLPVVILTAKADDELRIRLLRAGAADYVMKPFSVQELKARVDNLMAGALAGEALRASETAALGLAATRQDAEQRILALLESAPDAIVVVDRQGRIELINRRVEALFGYERDELLGEPVEMLLPERLRAAHVGRRTGFFEAHRARPMGAGIALAGRRKDGTEVPIDVALSPYDTADGTFVTASIRDITERRAIEDRLRLHNERFRATFDDAPIGMAIVDLRPSHGGVWLDVNAALADTLGYSRDALRELAPDALGHPDDRDAPSLQQLALDQRPQVQTERRLRHASGHYVWTRISISAIRDSGGIPDYAIVHIEDVTARKEATDQLARAALHDPLTGLANRSLLLNRLTQLLAGLDRSGGVLAVMFIDLDGFKHINDTFGHSAGDDLLIEVAQRLQTVVRPTDTAARMAGDEFVVVFHDLHDASEAVALAQRVADVIGRPVTLEGQIADVSASIGVTTTRKSGRRAEELLREADAAMYRAKQHGRHRVEIFDQALANLAQEGARTTADLRHALANDGLRLHYQPIVDLDTGVITGFEALLRLAHPTRGLLAPDEFLATAEASGLIVPIGAWVLREACRQLAAWDRPGRDPLTMWVNVSARQVMHGDLDVLLTAALDESAADPGHLCVEMTESVFADTSPHVLETLHQIKAHGVRLAIDDFGTGYSSLVYLKRFPIDAIKIDRGFTTGLDTKDDDTAIIDAITNLGSSLGLSVIAEGIETDVQLAGLQRLGCRLGQGYLFAKPADAQRSSKLLAAATTLRAGLGTRLTS